MIKSRRMRWAGHVICKKEVRNTFKKNVRRLKGRNYIQDLIVSGG
jgi:hypothetical protein